jgi:hypothetical protein
MTAPAVATPVAGPLPLTRLRAFSRDESRVVVLALGAVALHILDDNYLQPRAGTSAGDHLTSGLVPLAILLGVAMAYPYLPAALRGHCGDLRRRRAGDRLPWRLLPKYYGAAGEPKAMWQVPGSEHTGGIEAGPAEYEQRVIAFFDRSLLIGKR